MNFYTRRAFTLATYAKTISYRYSSLIRQTDMKSSTGDERAVVDHFCVPNLTDDAFHRRRRGRSRSCELRYRRRARKYVGAR